MFTNMPHGSIKLMNEDVYRANITRRKHSVYKGVFTLCDVPHVLANDAYDN